MICKINYPGTAKEGTEAALIWANLVAKALNSGEALFPKAFSSAATATKASFNAVGTIVLEISPEISAEAIRVLIAIAATGLKEEAATDISGDDDKLLITLFTIACVTVVERVIKTELDPILDSINEISSALTFEEASESEIEVPVKVSIEDATELLVVETEVTTTLLSAAEKPLFSGIAKVTVLESEKLIWAVPDWVSEEIEVVILAPDSVVCVLVLIVVPEVVVTVVIPSGLELIEGVGFETTGLKLIAPVEEESIPAVGPPAPSLPAKVSRGRRKNMLKVEEKVIRVLKIFLIRRKFIWRI